MNSLENNTESHRSFQRPYRKFNSLISAVFLKKTKIGHSLSTVDANNYTCSCSQAKVPHLSQSILKVKKSLKTILILFS